MKFKIKKYYKYIKNYIISDGLLKNILLVSGGTVLAQLINILSQPLITRLYNPSQYGMLTIFSSVLLIFRFATLSYEEAIPIAKNDDEAYNLVVIAHSLVLFIAFLFIALYFYNGDYILKLLEAQDMEKYWLAIPIGIVIQGIFLILTQWMYRKKNFKFISNKNILQSVSGNLTKIGLGVLNFKSVGLIIGRIMIIGGAVIPLISNFVKENISFMKNISIKSLYNVAKKYINFPLYQTPSILSTNLRNQLPIIMLSPLFGSQVIGYIGLTDQIIRLPMTLIGKPVMSVFYSEIASLGSENPEEIKKISKKLFKQLLILGLVPLLIIVIFGPFLFSFVFGNEWAESGVYARILMFYIYADFIFSPVSRVFEVFNKQKTKMIIDVSGLLSLILTFIIGGYLNLHVFIMLSIYTLIMSLIFFIIYITSMKILNEAIDVRRKNENN